MYIETAHSEKRSEHMEYNQFNAKQINVPPVTLHPIHEGVIDNYY